VRRDIGVSEIVAIVNGAFPYLRRDGGSSVEHERLLAFVVTGLAKAAGRSPPQKRKR
jgi:hypothetical protein